MKYSTVILALAATISAQSIADLQATIPQCAQACLAAAVASSGCSATDYKCQCTTGNAAIKSSATDCITKALGQPTGCSIPDALKVQPITDKICAAAAAMPAAAPSSSMAPVVAPSSMAPVAPSSMPAPVAPSSSAPEAAHPASSAAPISIISDGQIQATTAAPKPSAPAAPMPAANGTYSTVYTTSVYTVTSCAPSVTACPVGKVTTETVSLYTTFCPASSAAHETTTVLGHPVETSPAAANPPAKTSAPAVVGGGKNSTMVTSGKASPTATTPSQFTGAASNLQVGGFFGVVAALAAFAL